MAYETIIPEETASGAYLTTKLFNKLNSNIKEHVHTNGQGGVIPLGGVANDAITQAHLRDECVDNNALAYRGVTSVKIVDGAIITYKLGVGSVSSVNMATGMTQKNQSVSPDYTSRLSNLEYQTRFHHCAMAGWVFLEVYIDGGWRLMGGGGSTPSGSLVAWGGYIIRWRNPTPFTRVMYYNSQD